MSYKTEKYASGKYDVIYTGLYPRRIGHIVGANKTYLAERGPVNLGYFKTRKGAMQAIIAEYERPHTPANPIPLTSSGPCLSARLITNH